MRQFGWVLVLTGVGLPPPHVRADDYFLTVFTAETVPFRPTHTHTFVVAVRTCQSPDGSVRCCEGGHISWFPASLRLRGLTALPERGVNLSVPDTFERCRLNGMRVSVWGPYRIDRGLFEALAAQQARLESGQVLYKPTDNLYPSDLACNCYHAIWRPVAPCRKYSGPFNCGDASGSTTLRLFRPWLVQPWETHDWLLTAIVPPGDAVVRRAFDDRPGRIDAIRSALGR